MNWKGQNWIKITTDAEVNLIDLCQVETATKMKNGNIRLWMKSGRFVDISGTDGKFVDEVWERLEANAKLDESEK